MGSPPKSAPAGLDEHLVFSGDDLSSGREVSSRVFCPHRVRPVDRRGRPRMRMYAASVGDLTVAQVSYGTPVRIHADPRPERFFCVQLVHRGRAQVTSGSRRVLSTRRLASVPTPDEPLDMRWEANTAQTVIKVGVPEVRRYLTGLLGHEPGEEIRPTLALDLAGDGRRWLAIYDLLLAEIASADRPGGPSPASAAAVQDLVLSSLLLHHPTNYLAELTDPVPRGTRHYVRRAIEYADQNLGEALTVARLAEVAGVGVRALQDGFREAVGSSPTVWIRSRRLERAHADLTAADPGDGITVTDIAMRWGFSHLGRFSVRYRERFGVSPHETLRG
jgi:AraC-like DNA-binding protein